VQPVAPAPETAPLRSHAPARSAASRERRGGERESRLAAVALVLGTATLIAFMGFDAGGYFLATQAIAAVALTGLLLVRLLQAERPFAGLAPATLMALAALAAYAALTLASALWSHAAGRALVEFQRAWLYLLVLSVFATLPASRANLRRLVAGMALGILAVCLAGLASRVAPDVWRTAPDVANERLSYPVTYWNALGLLAALGIVLAAQLTCSLGERRLTRAAAAAALPLLAATLFFTFSRGAIAALAVGLLLYALVGRPRALLGGALAALPPTALTLAFAYRANLLDTVDPTTPAAVAQGHRVALAALLCAAAAAGVRLLCAARLDARLAAALARRSGSARRRQRVAGLAALAATCAVAIPALGVPATLAHDWTRFASGATPTGERGDLRRRLTDPSNNNRTELWRVALDAFSRSPLHGRGAGTYQLSWERSRPRYMYVVDAHSLYLQAMAELGVPGVALLAVLVGAVLVGLGLRARGAQRSLYGALLALASIWALHAGVDWDWQMPVVTIPFLAAAGLALGPRPARRARRATRGAAADAANAPRGRVPRSDAGAADAPRGWVPRSDARLALGLACLATLALPVLAIGSQRRLDEAERALYASDCATATRAASASVGWLGVRAQPYEVLGFCDLRRALPHLGVQAMEQAVARDRASWEPWYALAIARGAAGLDPRPALARAARLDPREPLLRRARAQLEGPGPAEWVRGAAVARDQALASNRLSIKPA
jgi:O-antigen ligase/polysaccharide polymerase Wzy-like membrane protein